MCKCVSLLMVLVLGGCATTTANCVVGKDGEIPVFGYYYNLPLVVVEIEGKQELMVVDTGSVTSTLTPSAAANLGIKDIVPYPLALTGIDGPQSDVPSTYRTIAIPGIDIQNTLFLIDSLLPVPSGDQAAIDERLATMCCRRSTSISISLMTRLLFTRQQTACPLNRCLPGRCPMLVSGCRGRSIGSHT